MSHELTFSVNIDGREVVLPSVVAGQENPELAIKMFMQGKLAPLGVFDTVNQANSFAQQRSEQPPRQPGLLGILGRR